MFGWEHQKGVKAGRREGGREVKSKKLKVKKLSWGGALLLIVLWLSCFVWPVQGKVIYVNAGAGLGGDGTSWADGYNLLQDGLDDAGSGDEIWVAAGTYYPTAEVGGTGERYKTFQLMNGVGVYGGFRAGGDTFANRDPNQYETILSGDIGTVSDNSDNCYHVFYHPSGTNLDASAILDGFTMSAGNADGSGDDDGGGMFNWSSSPTVTNCTFTGNSANSTNSGGGGMYNYSNSSPTVVNCTFSGNQAIQGNTIACDYPIPVQITNCILWDGNDGIWNYDGSTFIINYSNIQGGWPGLGNIDEDPLFVREGYWDPNGTPGDETDDFLVEGDYHLRSEAGRWEPNSGSWVIDSVTSPCIDKGNPGTALGEEPESIYLYRPGKSRPRAGVPHELGQYNHNVRVNMGAYGGTEEASKTPAGWGLLADLTNDGIVNGEDYLWQAADWLESAVEQAGDLDRDGNINILDMGLLLYDWLNQSTWYD